MDLPGLLHISVLAERRAQGPNFRQMMKDRISADLCLTSREGREAEVGYGANSAPEDRFRLYILSSWQIFANRSKHLVLRDNTISYDSRPFQLFESLT